MVMKDVQEEVLVARKLDDAQNLIPDFLSNNPPPATVVQAISEFEQRRSIKRKRLTPTATATSAYQTDSLDDVDGQRLKKFMRNFSANLPGISIKCSTSSLQSEQDDQKMDKLPLSTPEPCTPASSPLSIDLQCPETL